MAGGPAIANNAEGGFLQYVDPRRKWFNNRRLIVLNAWIVLLLITSSTNGYDGSMMNGLQSVPQWRDYFNTPHGSQLGLLNAIQYIGSLGAFPFAPYVSDGIGRRKAILFGAALMCVGAALQTAAQNISMFIGARFLVGFGLAFATNAAPMLVTELSYPLYRAQLTAAYNSLWYSGSIIAAWTTFGTFKVNSTWSWRIPSALQALPSVLQIFLVWFMPESPRWLVSKGKDEAALKTLAYYHADGDANDPLVQYQFQEIKSALEFDRTVTSNVSWGSLFTTPGNRKRMRIIIAIAFFSQWSGNGLVSYYLNKIFDGIHITDPTTQLLINGILQIWNLGWALGASAVCERFGRRKLFLTSTFFMFVFFTLQGACYALASVRDDLNAGHATIAFIFLYYAAYDIAFSPLIVLYTVEILPYQLRAKGFNIYGLTISVALVFNQYVNPIALQNIGWKYYLVYICWIIFEGVYLYFFVIETKNLTLEETAALFDGDEATKNVTRATQGLAEDSDEKGSSSPDEKA